MVVENIQKTIENAVVSNISDDFFWGIHVFSAVR